MTQNKIEFREGVSNTWVMRITADRRIEVNEDVDVTEAAKLVLASMQNLLTPQRTWVGLDDDEIIGMTCDCVDDGSFDIDCAIDFGRQIERALKRRNSND